MPRGNPSLNDFPDSERCKGINVKTGKQCKQKKQNYCDYCLAHDPSEQAKIKRTKRAESMHRGIRIKSKARGVRHKAAKKIIRIANEADAAMDNDLQNNETPSGIDQVIAFQADLLFRGYEIIENQDDPDLDDILSLLRATAPITKALELKEKLKAKSGGKLISTLKVLTALDQEDDDDDDDQAVIVINDPGIENKLGEPVKEPGPNEYDDDADDD
jgi:hypothetical protein